MEQIDQNKEYHEELNELMKAEAKIYGGDIEGGLALIDAVRTYQGAGLAAVAGSTPALTAEQAKEELRRERRTGLVFRALSFYDARRWGITDKGGPGRTGARCAHRARSGVLRRPGPAPRGARRCR